MAIAKTYYVSFSPAERQAWGGYMVSMSLMGGGTRHTITGDLATLETEVRRLAREYGRTCSPYIRQPKGDRAVPGFKALRSKLNIIDVQGACILTAENMHTADDCTMHDHEHQNSEA